MKYIQVAYAAAYMDLSKIFDNPDDYINKDGFIVFDGAHQIIDKNEDPNNILGFIERAQKSKHGRAYVVLCGVMKDDSLPGSRPTLF